MPRVTNADKVMEKMKTEWQRRGHLADAVGLCNGANNPLGDDDGMTRVAFASGILTLHRQGRIEVGYMKADGSVQVATPKQGKPPSGTELAYRIKA